MRQNGKIKFWGKKLSQKLNLVYKPAYAINVYALHIYKGDVGMGI